MIVYQYHLFFQLFIFYSLRLFIQGLCSLYLAILQEAKDDQWKRAMEYLKVVSELNYMTQIVIMLYEDPNKVAGIYGILCLYSTRAISFD